MTASGDTRHDRRRHQLDRHPSGGHQVQVGTQVSGTIESLGADFNSIVKRGQVLARLDRSLFQTQVEQNRANLVRAEADVERLRVALEDARTKLARAETLARQQLLPQSELDAAAVAVRSAEAQVRSAEAQVAQARAERPAERGKPREHRHHRANRRHRAVAVGRRRPDGRREHAGADAVRAGGRSGQDAGPREPGRVGHRADCERPVACTFTVDAHPGRTFEGIVAQIRLQPQTVQNVVTYSVLIDAPNRELMLKPGMTANVTIEVAGGTTRSGCRRPRCDSVRPARPAGRPGRRAENGELTAVDVTAGLSDGQFTEIVDGELAEGDTLAVRQSTPEQNVRPAATSSPFQLMQPPDAGSSRGEPRGEDDTVTDQCSQRRNRASGPAATDADAYKFMQLAVVAGRLRRSAPRC